MKKKNFIFSIFVILIGLVAAHTGVDESSHHMGGCSWMVGVYGNGLLIFWTLFITFIIVGVGLLITLLTNKNQRNKK